MQVDVWYNVMLQELVERDPNMNELLEEAEVVLEPEPIDEEETD